MGEKANGNRILLKMLDRLFASLANGPSLNARPHASRQRVDWTQLARLGDASPEQALRALLSPDRKVKLKANIAQPRWMRDETNSDEHRELSNEQRAEKQKWAEQQSLLQKLRGIAEDARTYEQDTGVHVLNVGFPLLALPGGAFASRASGATRRVLAPVAFVPVSVTVARGATQSVEIACKGEGTDLVVPNTALFAWLEQQTGKEIGELFSDEEGAEPWREICEQVKRICQMLDISLPELFAPPPSPGTPGEGRGEGSVATASESESQKNPHPYPLPEYRERGEMPSALALVPAPRAEESEAKPTLVCSAVLGLFPMTNQGLLRDMQAMCAGEPISGPIESFIHASVELDVPQQATPEDQQNMPVAPRKRMFAEDQLVAAADPCQRRAVKLARQSKGLVIHGPPGTGKSQTITNIVGDHLSRGERVLLVCDKRTALDVVYNRLEHLGLAKLCALVHDPQRDQRDLYRSIREQLEELSEATSATDEHAARKVEKIDSELQALHDELTRVHEALMTPRADSGGISFSELVGQWLKIPADEAIKLDANSLGETSIAELERAEHAIDDILHRSAAVNFASNPWRKAIGTTIEDFLARPMDEVRGKLDASVNFARQCDATADANVPPFPPQVDLLAVAAAREKFAARIERLISSADAELLARWAKQKADAVSRAAKRIAEHQPLVTTIQSGPLDAELIAVARANLPTVAAIAPQLAALAAYLDVASKWHAMFAFGRKSAASKVLNPYGLTLSAENAARLQKFLTGLRARLVLQALCDELQGASSGANRLDDDELIIGSIATMTELLCVLSAVDSDALLRDLGEPARKSLTAPQAAPPLLDGLRKSPARAAGIVNLEKSFENARLFDVKWLAAVDLQLRAGKTASQTVQSLAENADTIEGVIRVRDGLTNLGGALKPAVEQLVAAGVESEAGQSALRRAVLEAEISRRLRADTSLQNIDGQRMSSSFERYRALETRKRDALRQAVLHRWVSKQKERLLAATGSRLNSAGADLRRRLTSRGERAMRLRQVIAVGRKIDGGDPLFDLRPVWMASPETVAQLFSREPVFDVVVFDEASQCRLEEALPVLTRGRRVVIAGDPKQLPPTRFFESAIAQSDDDEIESDQQLFEMQQGEIEDLLGAALNLSIEQCYLDVHYRSRNADLIEFSNQYFYNKRLQAIPGHPSNRARFAPLTLYRAGGTYKDGENEIEAEKVVQIVRDLLRRADPPSVGIACFNIDQRDLIVEKLDALAAADADFGRRLSEARTRRGEGSFEGLFVKNLENVQGDERDHMIISTTYGPDAKTGRFYKRFGPLGRAGGGRRLNVLVTRARDEVHLVTSIPAEVYRAIPPVPPGEAPGGGWLLFAYLHYAEKLADAYEKEHAEVEAATDAKPPAAKESARVNVRASRFPSTFAESLARSLASSRQIGSDVHWGNDGFCVDVALHHPQHPEDVTVGVLCDASRFAQAEDPVEWDVFRTAIHQSQGWKLHRLWSPHFFRDPSGCANAIVRDANRIVATEEPKNGIRVV